LRSLRTDDLDPAHRTVQVPYSAPTGVLLSEYLVHRAITIDQLLGTAQLLPIVDVRQGEAGQDR
jgi:hypothetical protein